VARKTSFPRGRLRLKAIDLEPAYTDLSRPPTFEDVREDSRRKLSRLKAQLAVTRNPLCAWVARDEARAAKISEPAWVRRIFDVSWENLRHLLQDSPPKEKQIDREIRRALGLINGGVMVQNWMNLFSDPADIAGPNKRLSSGRLNPYLRKKDGAYNPFKKFKLESEEFHIAWSVYDAGVEGHTKLYAYQLAAAFHKVKQRRAERAWAAYQDYFPIPATFRKVAQ
jgi:hypothetical protein